MKPQPRRCHLLAVLCHILMLGCAAAFITGTTCTGDPTAGGSSETGNSGLGKIRVEVFDNPVSIDSISAVYITLREIAINELEKGWLTLSRSEQRINFLALINGNRALVAQTEIPPGTYTQLRLSLGSDNIVETADSLYTLLVPSSTIKIDINSRLVSDSLLTLLVDLDLSQSLSFVEERYRLEPHFYAFELSRSATIAGSVVTSANDPVAGATVRAVSLTDSSATLSDKFGSYLLTVPEGIFAVTCNHRRLSSADTTYRGIVLEAGSALEGINFVLSQP